DTTLNIRPSQDSKLSLITRVSNWFLFEPSKYELGLSGEAKFNYQAFNQSKYVYLIGGRLRTLKRDPKSKIRLPVISYTLSLLVLPMVIYLIFDASWCWHNISPAIVIVFVYCWLQAFLNCSKAAFLDPGTLPRNVHLVDNVSVMGLPEEYYTQIRLPGPELNKPVSLKYCTACYIWRPIRSSHCSRCNSCTLNMDHHCKWLSNCVGQRNYWFFINFLIFTVIDCIMLCGMSYFRIHRHGVSSSKMSLFLAVYGTIMVLYPTLLLVYHICLGFTGITTREYLN
ncbi:hypothetical protein CANARDRAFT_184931, partial [[Candida] arabinofermentans NRRL YB-2248]